MALGPRTAFPQTSLYLPKTLPPISGFGRPFPPGAVGGDAVRLRGLLLQGLPRVFQAHLGGEAGPVILQQAWMEGSGQRLRSFRRGVRSFLALVLVTASGLPLSG